YDLSQLSKMDDVESVGNFGRRIDSVARENRSVHGQENRRIQTTEERNLTRESSTQNDVENGNGRTYIQRVDSAICYGLKEKKRNF
ncbi:MAG: hypothetical protein IJY57_01165, partial [Clostridia bacterium]|nr:hypothetical protein [Clostridia bacterium]